MTRSTMTKARCTKSFLILCMLAVTTSGCASRKTMPGPSFHLTNSESLVFGRLEFVVDGQPTQPIETSYGRALWHFSPFTSVSDLATQYMPGKYMFVLDREDGYFAAAIPPGDYYFVELIAKVDQGPTLQATRSYVDSCGPPLFVAVRNAVVLIFHAKPGAATYIGTIQLTVSRNSESWCTVRTRGGSFVKRELRRATVVESWTIINDADVAAKAFHGLFPNVPTPETVLVTIEPCNLE